MSATENHSSPEKPIESPEPGLKLHPLHSTWSFWYDTKQQNPKPQNISRFKDYKMFENSLQCIGSFNTVEDFWR